MPHFRYFFLIVVRGGSCAVHANAGTQTCVATIDAGPNDRHLYHVPGVHGASYRDRTAEIQFNTKTRSHRVTAFLNPFDEQPIGYAPVGTYGSTAGPDGSNLLITWNGCRQGAGHSGRCPFNLHAHCDSHSREQVTPAAHTVQRRPGVCLRRRAEFSTSCVTL